MHKNYKLSSLMLQMDGLKDGRVDLVFLSKLFLEKKKQQHIKWLAHGEKSFFLRIIYIFIAYTETQGEVPRINILHVMKFLVQAWDR